MLLRIAVPLFAVAGTGVGESPLFRAMLLLHSAVMLPPTKIPMMLRAKVFLMIQLQVKVLRA